MTSPEESQPLPIDISLLNGLESAMSEEEQKEITALMTSGDPEKVAQAATVLSGFADFLKHGIVPASRTAAQTNSVRALQETSYTNEVAVRKAMLKGDNDTVQKVRLQEAEVKEKKRLHPLPARMPRYVWIDPFNPDGTKKEGLMGVVGVPQVGPIGKGILGRKAPPSLTFYNDEWDGTLKDAFTKITIVPIKGDIKKEPIQTSGVSHILEAAPEKQLEDGPVPRVLINQVRNDAGKKGLHPGDVITHVNGKAFSGNADDLNKIIEEINEEGTDKLNIVVNAELCVAEALRVRAIC